MDEAIVQFRTALEIDPNYAVARNNLGTALFLTGNSDEAFTQLQKTIQIKPDYAVARVNLANVLLKQGNLDESITQYQKALQLEPDVPEASFHLGYALCLKGDFAGAIAQYQKALALKPDDVEARNNLAWLLACCPQASLRNGNEAVKLSERANEITGNTNPIMLRTLAAASAEAGRFPEAVATAQRAVQLAGAQSDSALADKIRSEMKLYQAGKPFHSQ
jgi:tetratricopeptide (TPR) repeat protein